MPRAKNWSDDESEDSRYNTRSKSRSKSNKARSSKSKRRSMDDSSIGDSSDDGGRNTVRSDLTDDFSNRDSRTTRERDEPDVLLDDIRKSIREKLLSNGGKKLRVLTTACRKADDNTGSISKDEFKSILHTRMGTSKKNKFDRDEIRWLVDNLKGRQRNKIMYEKLKDVITDGEVVFDDDDDDNGWKGYSTENWAVRSGSVGEWLQNVATPQDRRNFKDFMSMLEVFEKSRGIDARRSMEKQGNAITVRLGPMLNVALKFYVE